MGGILPQICSAPMSWLFRLLMVARWRKGAAPSCRIVNRTGKPLVMRSKYRSVWEGEQWRLAEAGSGSEMVVPASVIDNGWKPDVYTRLGVFLEEGGSDGGSAVKGSFPLYISSRNVRESQEIIFTCCPSNHALLRMVTKPRDTEQMCHEPKKLQA